MKHFIITILIGFALIALLLVRVIGIDQDAGTQLSKVSGKTKSGKSTRDSHGSKSGKMKSNADAKQIKLNDGALEHVLKTYYDSGVLSSEWPFKNSKLEGSAKLYYPNGATWREISFKAGQPDGSARSFYSNGLVLSDGDFTNSLPDGVKQQYYANGVPWFVIEYEEGRIAQITVYSEDGTPAKEDSIHLPSSLTRVTRKQTFYKNGKPSSEWIYQNGLLEGTARIFRNDESIEQELVFEAGQANGTWKSFDEKGMLRSQMNYVDGLLEDYARIYYPSGRLWVETKYKNGRMVGIPQAFSETGKLFEDAKVV